MEYISIIIIAGVSLMLCLGAVGLLLLRGSQQSLRIKKLEDKQESLRKKLDLEKAAHKRTEDRNKEAIRVYKDELAKITFKYVEAKRRLDDLTQETQCVYDELTDAANRILEATSDPYKFRLSDE